MAFAQYYYDPALEFERLLDDANTSHGPSPSTGSGASSTDAPVVDRPAVAGAVPPPGAKAKSKSTDAITRSTSAGGESGAFRWFGEGFLKRRASTGSVNGHAHPGIPK